jgi:uncharacterized protein
MIYNYKSFDLEIKDIDPPKGIVMGYFSKFDSVDSDNDVIRAGAFTKSINENGPNSMKPRIKHLLNHNPSLPLGSISMLVEDAYGLYFESKVGTHTLGKDFVKMVESDLIKEHSIGFRTIKEEMNTKEGYNELLELKLYEGSSLTGWGANENTPLLGLKSNIDQLNDRIKAFEKFVRNTDATDETIEFCLLEIKQLAALVESMKSTEPAVKAVQPEDETKKLKEAILLLTLENFK